MAGTTATDRKWWRRQAPSRRAGDVNLGRRERAVSAALGATLAVLGSTRRGVGWRLVALAGGALLLRSVSGHSMVYQGAGISSAGLGDGAGISVDESVVVNAPLQAVYAFWREPSALPAYFSHVLAVDRTGPGRTHWVLDTPMADPFTFDAEVVEQRANEVIAWRTLPGSEIEHAGSVRFRDIAGEGTGIRLRVRYVPPAGAAGFAVAKGVAGLVQRAIVEDLQRFRDALEGGDTVVGHARVHEVVRVPVGVSGARPEGESGSLPFEEA